jgi:hypothetical protein
MEEIMSRKSNIRIAATAALVAVSAASFAGLGSTGASAEFRKAPPGGHPIVSLLPCEAKLDYVPNQVGGVYVTNATGMTIPTGAKLTTNLRIGANSYVQTKTMLGNWLPGQKHLARTFIWHPNMTIWCTAAVL